MDWCGRVGEVRELFRSEWLVGYHWVVPKICSMPDRIGPVYYSPTFKFLNMTWYFGIYRYSRMGTEEWIGFDIRRSTDRTPMPARFSVGLMQADKSEFLLHRNQNFPSRNSVCSINEFLLKSALRKVKDKLAPSDELTVTCVIWPDVPSPAQCKEFWNCDQTINSGGEAHDHKKERKDTVTDDFSVTKVRSRSVETVMKSISESNMHARNDGTLRENSTRDEWQVRSLPLKMTRDASSSEFPCGRRRFNARSLSESALSSKEFCHSAQRRNFRGETHAHRKAIKKDASVTEDVPVTEDESQRVETQTKSVAVSDKPSGNDGKLREISRGVEWDISLPPSKTTWDVLSPGCTCGGMKYHFSMYSSELNSDDIYLGFVVNIPNDANFPLPIRWRMAVKRREVVGIRWVMNGQMIAQGECHQHAQEICIKRAELETSLTSDGCLTFVHYVSVGEVDTEKEVSVQTDLDLRLCLTYPEEGDYVHLIQKRTLDASIEEFSSESPEEDENHFIFAA